MIENGVNPVFFLKKPPIGAFDFNPINARVTGIGHQLFITGHRFQMSGIWYLQYALWDAISQLQSN
jgi:hypothetical protein